MVDLLLREAGEFLLSSLYTDDKGIQLFFRGYPASLLLICC